ncbi:MAG: CHASE3 domain-containing protein [Bryobacteraceae bacterium]
MGWGIATKLGISLGAGLLVSVGVSSYVSYHAVSGFIEDTRGVVHSHEVIREMEAFLIAFSRLETGVRGYLLTADRRYLKNYDRTISALDDAEHTLANLTSDNPYQQARLRQMGELRRQRIAIYDDTVKTAPQKAGRNRQPADVLEAGRPARESMRTLATQIERDEESLMSKRRAEASQSARNSLRLILFGGVFAFLATGLTAGMAIQRVTGSLRSLGRSIDSLSGGSFVQPLEVCTRDEVGDLTIGFNRMVARLKEAHETLLEQRNLLESILNNMGEGVAAVDADSSFVVYNPVCMKLLCYPSDSPPTNLRESSGRMWKEDLTVSLTRDELPLARALRGECVTAEVLAVKTTDGGPVRFTRVTARPFSGADGQIRGAVAVLSDVSEEREAANALAENQRLLQAILLALPVGVVVADSAGKISISNNVAKLLLTGHSNGRDLDSEIAMRWCGTSPSAEFPLFEALRHGRKVMEHEIKLRAPGAPERTLMVSAVPLLNAESQIAGSVAVVNDLTERARLEDKLREANHELETFSYSVSHDLRAPLRHIYGFTELLREHASGSLDEKSQRYLQTISAATGRMGKLIDDLLAFSRMGRTEMIRSNLDMGQIVREVVEFSQHEAAGRQVEWTIGSLPQATGDPDMIRQVLSNLISNALKYSSPKPITKIEISGDARVSETVYSIKDNGVGFDMKYASKLFSLFQRLHGPREFDGTGVGLSICARVVKRHGGRIWAEAAVDEGATFSFSLPAGKDRS